MTEQTTKAKPRAKRETVEAQQEKDMQNIKLGEDTEVILDEIDEVLEENAEEFVNSYIQQGGQ